MCSTSSMLLAIFAFILSNTFYSYIWNDYQSLLTLPLIFIWLLETFELWLELWWSFSHLFDILNLNWKSSFCLLTCVQSCSTCTNCFYIEYIFHHLFSGWMKIKWHSLFHHWTFSSLVTFDSSLQVISFSLWKATVAAFSLEGDYASLLLCSFECLHTRHWRAFCNSPQANHLSRMRLEASRLEKSIAV